MTDHADVMREIVVARRPTGADLSDVFELRTKSRPALTAGTALVRVMWLSVDATQRTWLNPKRTYTAPVGVGDVMRGGGVGLVIDSRSDDYVIGDWVYGETGWRDHVVASGPGLAGMNRVPEGVEPREMLGLFGVPGLTAYFGMAGLGRPQAGQRVFVSGVAGGVGSLAAQIARIHGAEVIGSAGSDAKCEWAIASLGLAACLNRKNQDLREGLRAFAPAGLDIVYDNVGGPALEAALDTLAVGARVILGGSVSSGYADDRYGDLPRNYMQLAFRNASLTGFTFLHYADRFADAFHALRRWQAEERIRCEFDVVRGLEHAPLALMGLLGGDNIGKRILEV